MFQLLYRLLIYDHVIILLEFIIILNDSAAEHYSIQRGEPLEPFPNLVKFPMDNVKALLCTCSVHDSHIYYTIFTFLPMNSDKSQTFEECKLWRIMSNFIHWLSWSFFRGSFNFNSFCQSRWWPLCGCCPWLICETNLGFQVTK